MNMAVIAGLVGLRVAATSWANVVQKRMLHAERFTALGMFYDRVGLDGSADVAMGLEHAFAWWCVLVLDATDLPVGSARQCDALTLTALNRAFHLWTTG